MFVVEGSEACLARRKGLGVKNDRYIYTFASGLASYSYPPSLRIDAHNSSNPRTSDIPEYRSHCSFCLVPNLSGHAFGVGAGNSGELVWVVARTLVSLRRQPSGRPDQDPTHQLTG